MDAERLTILRDHIAALPEERFRMSQWAATIELLSNCTYGSNVPTRSLTHDCGTCGCIGGWAQAIFGLAPKYSDYEVGDYLGLTREQTSALFFPAGHYTGQAFSYESITKGHAIDTLTYLIETGEVRWM